MKEKVERGHLIQTDADQIRFLLVNVHNCEIIPMQVDCKTG